MKVDDLLSKFREHDLRKSNVPENNDYVEKEFFRRYSKLLRSFPFTGDLIEDAKVLNVYVHGDGGYPVSKSFNRAQLGQSFFIFLVMVAEGKYLKGDYRSVKQLITYLRKYYNHMFKKDRRISRILRRLPFAQLLPSGLIRRVREHKIHRGSS